MQYNKNWSKTSKSPEKRKPQPPQQSDPLKRGPFKLTPALVKFYEHNIFDRKSDFSKPKSAYRHGLRVLFSECDPFLVKEIAELARNAFSNHTAAHSRLDKGYFEFAFKTAAEADAASKLALQIGERFVPTLRTRYARDTNILIRFEDLPCTLHRNDLLEFLHNGLCQYGQVAELQLNKDPLFPNSSNSRGYAIIEPLPGVAENVNLIPRLAHFAFQGLISPSFRVIPEKAPTVCTVCKNLGHEMNACPEQLLKLLKKQSEDPTEDESVCGSEDSYDDNCSKMGSEVDGDKFLETIDEKTDTTESYEWGEFASYKLVKPTTKEQRREAHLKAQENSTTDNPENSSQTPEIAPQPNTEIPTSSQSKASNNTPPHNATTVEDQSDSNENSNQSHPEYTPIINPFGDVPFISARNPKGAGRKSRASRSRPGAGRPKNSSVDAESQSNIVTENHFECLANVNATASISGSENHSIFTQDPENNFQTTVPPQYDSGKATHQYSTEEVFYDPSQESFVDTMESHSHNGNGLSQY